MKQLAGEKIIGAGQPIKAGNVTITPLSSSCIEVSKDGNSAIMPKDRIDGGRLAAIGVTDKEKTVIVNSFEKAEKAAKHPENQTLQTLKNYAAGAREKINAVKDKAKEILACDYGLEQLTEIAETDYRIDFNQGMDIRLLTDDVCRLLKKIRWIKYIRFSYDSISQLPYFERATEMFERHKISKSKIFIYILVQSDLQDADYRVQELNKLCRNFNLYAQAERNGAKGIIPNAAQLEFAQRYVYGKCYKKENWRDYCNKRKYLNL